MLFPCCWTHSSQAEDIEMLLHTFPSLRVAYIDEVQSINRPAQYFSVLIRSVRGKGGQPTIEEVYRVKLPGNPILGEGESCHVILCHVFASRHGPDRVTCRWCRQAGEPEPRHHLHPRRARAGHRHEPGGVLRGGLQGPYEVPYSA